jgi:hypothetical protein
VNGLLSHNYFSGAERFAVCVQAVGVSARRQAIALEPELVTGSFLPAHKLAAHIKYIDCQSFKLRSLRFELYRCANGLGNALTVTPGTSGSSTSVMTTKSSSVCPPTVWT